MQYGTKSHPLSGKPSITMRPVSVVWMSLGGRVVPEPFAAVIYPVGDITAGSPFKGWTFNALIEGRAARWYGSPVAVFTDHADAVKMAHRLHEWFRSTLEDAEIPFE